MPEHDAMHTGGASNALLANEITRKFDLNGSKHRLLESNLRVIHPPARSAGKKCRQGPASPLCLGALSLALDVVAPSGEADEAQPRDADDVDADLHLGQ